MPKGKVCKIHYFAEEGKVNLNKTISYVKERAVLLGITKVIVFTSEGEGPRKAIESFKGTSVQIIAVTFPSDDDSPRIDEQTRAYLHDNRVNIVQGTLPFEEIIIPNTADVKLRTIRETLSLLSGGLALCVEAIIMATDADYVTQGERVIAMSADTAIVALAVRKKWLFAPWGMQIQQIICKPENLTLKTKELDTVAKGAINLDMVEE